MWSDDIHKKMDDSGESHYPAYDEKAWEKMEVLLDKHLPEKKRKRRILFFWLPLVLAGAGIFLFYRQQQNQSPLVSGKHATRSTVESKQNDLTSDGSNDKKAKGLPNHSQSLAHDIAFNKSIDKVEMIKGQAVDITGIGKENNIPGRTSGKVSANLNNKPAAQKKFADANSGNNISALNTKTSKNRNAEVVPNDESNKILSPSVPQPADVIQHNRSIPQTEPASQYQEPQADTAFTETDLSKDSLTNDKSASPSKNTPSKSPASKLTLNLSFGPDLSSVSFRQPGQVQMQYGIGAGYQLTKRLSVRTGFFAGKKVYDADSTTYKTPYPIHNLKEVEANCMVYEIPVSVLYHFGAKGKHSWFTSGGISSYIMKKETYGYHYQNAWGTPQYYQRTYKNENTHLFSVIQISAGYNYHLNDRLSFFAEPYVKMPVSGVGVGKVKLNSAGVLFTVGFKPFVHSK
jgi:hypothetical protein